MLWFFQTLKKTPQKPSGLDLDVFDSVALRTHGRRGCTQRHTGKTRDIESLAMTPPDLAACDCINTTIYLAGLLPGRQHAR